MSEKECEQLNLNDDDEYFKLLENKKYKIFYPNENSQEEFILKTLQELVELFVGSKVLDINIKVKIYLIDDTMINAAVCKRGNTYYISLFRGIINDLKDFVLNFVMTNFPYDFFQRQFERLYEEQFGVIEFFNEIDCEHYNLANNIANNILFLIVYHEIGHILSGHQEIYLNIEDVFWLETNQDKKGNMLFQAKELMADFFGMINALGVYNFSHHESLEEYAFYQCSYLISLYSLYIYFDKNNHSYDSENLLGTYEELFQRSHPHPAIRLLYMMDFLSNEIEFELKSLFKVKWLTEDNATETLRQIDGISYCAICEFSLLLPPEFRLLNKVYENRSIRLRQLVQNIASDLFEETYHKVTFVGFKGFGRVSDKYVEDLLQASNLFGKYDVVDK